ncbi:DNA/RNA non-specific endonuclease [Levilactobacillus yiduensis]|uniref:DNA/RNA non-specific endonuclease n=1 Tax=Levilactobacillus yiduensis TaxID=2953880 RepID=UPI002157BC4E|nr:DNA/RNA non-specific endonuclease [Levilactobacillus yiduensis]
MKKLLISTLTILSLGVVGLSGCARNDASATAKQASTKVVYDHQPQKKAKRLEKQNSATAAKLASDQQALDHKRAKLKQRTKAKPATQRTKSQPTLASRTYAGQQEITLRHNNPGFTAKQLSKSHGAWQTYHALDRLNRVTGAAALLNQSLMPSAQREALTVDPTGWHNKRTHHGWLYNRSHLIGYQFTGQNNNPKNLMTGTRTLNNPLMLHNEMDIATYLHASAKHYVRYTVTPVFRGNELVARGVHMRAQSLGSNAIRFNVYIFNVEPGYTIDYATGYSHAS